ncbi:hypothetical protein CEXT_696021 [Caerostris extrusa]|uniref:Uncharacterized protein n=1 Tax=Caerostris extrusa TaxID=172846 RepID=A0AAV4RY48_CAEEX|nr:hypothetical protein CEXT_696021 [Caerostris extrusa]
MAPQTIVSIDVTIISHPMPKSNRGTGVRHRSTFVSDREKWWKTNHPSKKKSRFLPFPGELLVETFSSERASKENFLTRIAGELELQFNCSHF